MPAPPGGEHSELPSSRIDRIHAALPQTQCTRCGYPDCHGYAQAVDSGEADINRCPPGGDEGIRRLSALTGRPYRQLDPAHGVEGPRRLALIDETWCIGCTLCIKACPVDCIVGASRRMHTVIQAQCTGCELCVPACPVDCIALVPTETAGTGWAAWSSEQADAARQRYEFREARRARERREQAAQLAEKAQDKLEHLAEHSLIADGELLERKRTRIQAAVDRARERAAATMPASRLPSPAPGVVPIDEG